MGRRANATKDVLQVLSGLPANERKEVSVAAVNGPKMTVISGSVCSCARTIRPVPLHSCPQGARTW